MIVVMIVSLSSQGGAHTRTSTLTCVRKSFPLPRGLGDGRLVGEHVVREVGEEAESGGAEIASRVADRVNVFAIVEPEGCAPRLARSPVRRWLRSCSSV